MASAEVQQPAPPRKNSSIIEIQAGSGGTEAQNSFSADSPYYESYVENEVRNIAIMHDTLHDIAARTKTFGKCGSLMSEATRRLALSCRLRRPYSADDEKDMAVQERRMANEAAQRRHALGDEMASLLGVMANMLEEIADAQVQMVQSFEATMVASLEHFADTESRTAQNLKESAEQSTESAEQLLAKFLNGRHAAALNSKETEGGNDAWNKFSEQVGNHGSTFLSRLANRNKKDVKTSLSQGRNNITGSRQTSNSEDPMVQAASAAANMRLTLEQVRLAQATAELKRFQLLRHIVAHKQRRKFEIGENILASLHGVRAYYHHCSDLVTGLLPTMNRFQVEQESIRNSLEQKLSPSWKARENDIEGTIATLRQATQKASATVQAISNGNRNVIEQQSSSFGLDDIENKVQIWRVPSVLADSTRLQRDPTPGVFVEGWLYKKAAQRISLNPWTKRWFMMDSDGIYYFRSKDEIKKAVEGGNGQYSNALERVKICPVVLCTVREAPNEGPRFCFEVVTPNQKPLMLQARGPLEFQKWVGGIRNAIEMQLVHGNPNAAYLGQDSGKAVSTSMGSRSRSSSDDEILDEVNLPDFHDIDNEIQQFTEETAKAAQAKSDLVPQLMETNKFCADCGAPNPDWVSLNLGVLVCLECCGIHRSLGVHVSKVRSLKLDSLTESEARVILAIGNDNANAIWEAGTANQKGWEKPKGDATRKVREEWIKSKYLWRGFLAYKEGDGKSHVEREEKYCRDMYNSAKSCDILGIASALAHGAVAGWHNEDEEGRTSLHSCCLYKTEESGNEWKAIECAELLLQNGAKVDAKDKLAHGVLDCALLGNADRKMIEYLSTKAS